MTTWTLQDPASAHVWNPKRLVLDTDFLTLENTDLGVLEGPVTDGTYFPSWECTCSSRGLTRLLFDALIGWATGWTTCNSGKMLFTCRACRAVSHTQVETEADPAVSWQLSPDGMVVFLTSHPAGHAGGATECLTVGRCPVPKKPLQRIGRTVTIARKPRQFIILLISCFSRTAICLVEQRLFSARYSHKRRCGHNLFRTD